MWNWAPLTTPIPADISVCCETRDDTVVVVVVVVFSWFFVVFLPHIYSIVDKDFAAVLLCQRERSLQRLISEKWHEPCTQSDWSQCYADAYHVTYHLFFLFSLSFVCGGKVVDYLSSISFSARGGNSVMFSTQWGGPNCFIRLDEITAIAVNYENCWHQEERADKLCISGVWCMSD